MKFIIFSYLLAFFSLPAFSLLLEDAVISGKIKSYDDKVVSIIDRYGKTHTLPRGQISKKIILEKVKKISVRTKIKPEQFVFANLPYQLNDISKLKKPQIEKLVLSYMLFIKDVDQKLKAKGDYQFIQKEDHKYSNFYSYFLETAHADPTDYTCFWGGWPTSSNGSGSGGHCVPPFRSQLHTDMGSGDPLHYNSCGAGNRVYRCNPVLFGPSPQTHTGTGLGSEVAATGAPAVRVRPVPAADSGNGICVVADREEIVERCISASLPNLSAIIEGIQNDPAKAGAFENFTRSVAEFCRQARNSTNDTCGDLRERLAVIEFGRLNNVRRTVDPNESCTHQEHGSLGESIGSGSSSSNSCPGGLCYVRATCNVTGSGEGDTSSPLEITAVCGCSNLGANFDRSGTEPTNGQLLACINDQSITVVNSSLVPAGGSSDSEGESVTH